jgi:uncharacterized alkaline shock family protein YloU
MAFLHRVFRIIVLALFWALALGLLLLAMSEARWQGAAQLVGDAREEAALLGVILLLAGLVFALSGYSRRRKEKFLTFKTDDGTVNISTDAIADYVGKLGAEFQSIVRMWPRVAPAKHTIDILVDIRVRSGAQVHEVCELLQRRIREALAGGLGISDVRRVEVSVRDIVSEHRPA